MQVRVRSEHAYGSLKGRFQSLQELRFQIQTQRDLNYANMWTRCCLILHNMIIEIEEHLGCESSHEFFADEARRWDSDRPQGSDDATQAAASAPGDEGFIGSEGQVF